MYDVITVGAATKDIFVKSAAFETHQHAAAPVEACFPLGAKIELDDLVFETGGGGTNTAVTFARLGWKSAVITAVGTDGSGKEIAAALSRDNVDTKFVQVDDTHRTGSSIIVVTSSGERTVLVYRGASQSISGKEIAWRAAKTKWFYLSSLGGDIGLIKEILAHAKKISAKVAWNPGGKEIAAGLEVLRPLIAEVDILTLNKEEAEALAGKGLEENAALFAGIVRGAVIITDGGNGAYVRGRDGEGWHAGVLDVPRINTTGAGDAFGSGFIASLLRGGNLKEALAVGTWNATGVVQEMGAKRGIIKGYPTADDIKRVNISSWT